MATLKENNLRYFCVKFSNLSQLALSQGIFYFFQVREKSGNFFFGGKVKEFAHNIVAFNML